VGKLSDLIYLALLHSFYEVLNEEAMKYGAIGPGKEAKYIRLCVAASCSKLSSILDRIVR